MKQSGYDLSILRGRYYVKMGYTRVWNDVRYRFISDWSGRTYQVHA